MFIEFDPKIMNFHQNPSNFDEHHQYMKTKVAKTYIKKLLEFSTFQVASNTFVKKHYANKIRITMKNTISYIFITSFSFIL